MSAIEAVLFDWGDTLFAPPDAAGVIVATARERGLSIGERDARALWDELWAAGKSPDEVRSDRDLSSERHRAVWTALFARADARVPGLSTRLYEAVMDPPKWIPYEDARPTLEALRRRGVRVGLVSNTAYDLRGVMAAHGMRDLVDAYVLSYEVGVAKPSPRIFTVACERIGVPPARTLMVGDHPEADGAAAAAAGLRTYVLPAWSGTGPRGLARAVELVDASRRAGGESARAGRR